MSEANGLNHLLGVCTELGYSMLSAFGAGSSLNKCGPIFAFIFVVCLQKLTVCLDVSP